MDRSTKPAFNFVNLKHPDDLKDEETQLRIRRLAMTEVGKARRKPKTKRARNEIVLEFRNSGEEKPDFDRFGGGNIDPFSAYPVPLDDSARALLAHIFQPDTNHSSQMRGTWYPVGLFSATAFHNMLANSQNYIFQKRNGYYPSQDDALALTHHHKALRQAGELMKNAQTLNTDQAVAAVVSFMCHHALHGSFAGGEFHKHRNALIKIVALRGGFDAIETEHLRITTSWADLIGAFFQDIPPVVPLPQKWVSDSQSPPTSPRPFRPISLVWKQQLFSRSEWITIFDDVVQLISLDKAFNDEQLLLAVTSGSWMEPTLWRLLTIRPLQQGSERGHVIEEVCRLGTLLFLSPFWRMLGFGPVWTAAMSRNLLLLLMKHMVEWQDLKPLLTWVLYFAAIETNDLAERSQLVFMLAVVAGGMQLNDWGDIMNIVKSVLWVERVFVGTDDLIKDEVMAIIAQNAMRPVLVDTPPVFLEEFPTDVEED
ncbi:hypothetical protein CC86DRAFT_349539 [Ophiobolus disseminans]|uniref:Tachykinin family protein n=1 Tax=Ophiobolus disseminans TaxID=1469910 RepID=A0A6A6ZZW5_9PLEO|nr:hypothetical protein CC86DRAFT_349539 [Ophiobolus disseminans]